MGSASDGKQGSLSWITGSERIDKAVGKENASDVIDAVRAGKFEMWVVRTLPDGGTKMQVLDAAGNVKQGVDISKLLKIVKTGGQP